MKPITFKEVNTNIAKGQDEYLMLPSNYNHEDGVHVVCFELNDLDIDQILSHRKLWMHIYSGLSPIQPFSILALEDYFKQVKRNKEDLTYTVDVSYEVNSVNSLKGEMIRMMDLVDDRTDLEDVAKEYVNRAFNYGIHQKLEILKKISPFLTEVIEERIEHIYKHNKTKESDSKNNPKGELLIAASRLLWVNEDDKKEAPEGWDEEHWNYMNNKSLTDRIKISSSLLIAEGDRLT